MSLPKAENVVKPPSSPMTRNARASAGQERPCVDQLGERPDRDAPGDVDHERAKWERAGRGALHHAR